MERLKHIVHVNILLGAWLIIAPVVMGYSMSTVELVNDVGLGVLLITTSWWILAAGTGQIGASTLGQLAAIWLIAVPFAMRYQRVSAAFSNDASVGILSAIVGMAATWMLVRLRVKAAGHAAGEMEGRREAGRPSARSDGNVSQGAR